MVGRNGGEGEEGAEWRNGSASMPRCLALAIAQTCCLSFLLRGKGDIFRASRLVGGVSSTGEAVTSWRTNWTVRGNWADTGHLNTLESFSEHRITGVPCEPVLGVLRGGDVVSEHGVWDGDSKWGRRQRGSLQVGLSTVRRWCSYWCWRCGCSARRRSLAAFLCPLVIDCHRAGSSSWYNGRHGGGVTGR